MTAATVGLDAVLRAYLSARRGKRARPDVAAFEMDQERLLLDLHEELTRGRYQPSPYRSFTVHVPKERTIAALPFRDRVVQHLLMRALEPRIVRSLVPQTFACIRRRGTHAAIARTRELLRHHTYCLKLDVRKFFASIDREILRRAVHRHVRRGEACLLSLADALHDHEGPFERCPSYFEGDDLFATLRPCGLPIGNLTSQWWANLYLSPLDHRLANHLGTGAFVRYMDDVLVFSDSAERLAVIRDVCIETSRALRLRLHEDKTHITETRQGVRFLGFRFRRIGDSASVRLTTESATRMRRRFARLSALYAVGAVSEEHVRSSVFATLGHAQHGHTRALCRRLLEELALTRGGTGTPVTLRNRSASSPLQVVPSALGSRRRER